MVTHALVKGSDLTAIGARPATSLKQVSHGEEDRENQANDENLPQGWPRSPSRSGVIQVRRRRRVWRDRFLVHSWPTIQIRAVRRMLESPMTFHQDLGIRLARSSSRRLGLSRCSPGFARRPGQRGTFAAQAA